jgi:hypothetical protein
MIVVMDKGLEPHSHQHVLVNNRNAALNNPPLRRVTELPKAPRQLPHHHIHPGSVGLKNVETLERARGGERVVNEGLRQGLEAGVGIASIVTRASHYLINKSFRVRKHLFFKQCVKNFFVDNGCDRKGVAVTCSNSLQQVHHIIWPSGSQGFHGLRIGLYAGAFHVLHQ